MDVACFDLEVNFNFGDQETKLDEVFCTCI